MRKILFYRDVTQFSAEAFIREVNLNVDSSSGIEVDVNSPGGSPQAAWGMIKAFRDHKGSKKVMIHGQASSMMFYFLLFSRWVVAIQQSKSVVHRAAFPNEQNLDETQQKWLEDVNADLRSAFDKVVNIERFEAIGKEQNGQDFTVDRMFDITKHQIDVILNAQQLQEIGVVNQIDSLEPDDIFALNEMMASSDAPLIEVQESNNNQNLETMNSSELKEKYPDAVANLEREAIASAGTSAKDAAIISERDRVAAWNAWREVDAKAVDEGISAGNGITNAESNAFMAKSSKLAAASNLTGDDATIPTGDAPTEDQTAEELKAATNLDAFRAESKKSIGKMKTLKN